MRALRVTTLAVFLAGAFAVAGAPRDAAAQVDCSGKAEAYAEQSKQAASCRDTATPEGKRKCDEIAAATRRRLDAYYAQGCKTPGGAAGSSGAGAGGAGGGDPFGAANRAIQDWSARESAKIDEEYNDRMRAIREKRQREEEAEAREDARFQAEMAAMLQKRAAELAGLESTFNLAPESPTDPLANTRAARDVCRQTGDFIRIMNPARYQKMCGAPVPVRDMNGSRPDAVPIPEPPNIATRWPASTCSAYAKSFHDAMVGVARQHDHEQEACVEAVNAEKYPPLPHLCTKHAEALTKLREGLETQQKSLVVEINARKQRPVAQRSECTMRLIDAEMRATQLVFELRQDIPIFAAPEEPIRSFPPEATVCQSNQGAYRMLSATATAPDLESYCRHLIAFEACR